MVTLLIATGVALLCALAEWLHARRVRRVGRLAFGPAGRPRAWTSLTAGARCVAMGLMCWGCLTLLRLDGAVGASDEAAKGPPRRLLLCLDVSPSMFLQDAGPERKQSRAARARDALRSALDRLDMKRTRVSIVAFYTGAKPVVIDTDDANVVDNILNDLPLEQAFKAGQTDMYAGVRAAASLAAKWPPASATMIVVSDGDTLPDASLPGMPASIRAALVVGVGDPYRGSQIAGRSSRQDASSLKRLAMRLRGQYHDGNTKNVPSGALEGLTLGGPEPSEAPSMRTLALVAVGVGGTLLAAIAPALAAWGAPAPVRAAERAVRARAVANASNWRPLPGREVAQ